MQNNNNNEYRLSIINNKINELNFYINSIKSQKKEITQNLKRSDSLEEREIFFNNLQLLNSILINYQRQKTYLKKKKDEYYLIIYSKSKEERIRFLNIWKNMIDSYFNFSKGFKFEFDNQTSSNSFEEKNEGGIKIRKLKKS